jgi:hypothetical protein
MPPMPARAITKRPLAIRDSSRVDETTSRDRVGGVKTGGVQRRISAPIGGPRNSEESILTVQKQKL